MGYVEKFALIGIELAVVLGLVAPSPVWGQAARGTKGAGKVETEIEEITVTAQKREENIQEIPISVTALGGGQLESRNVTNVVDLGTVSPNLRIQPNPGSPSSTTISMRGLQTSDPESAFQPSVGLYVDGAYLAKMVGSNLDLEDLDRVEVLRGPQGTLYGRNTIGGAVNLITKRPNEERSLTAKTEVGNYQAFEGRLTVNLPLVGKNGFFQSDALGLISLRQTVGYKTHDGYFRNALPPQAVNAPNIPFLGGPASLGGGADYNNLNRVYDFTALRWQPTKDITIDYSLEYHRYRDHPSASQLTYVYPGSPVDGLMNSYLQKNRSDVTPSNALLMRDLASFHQQRDDGHHRMHTLTAAWDLGEVGPLGSVTLKSISSYRSFLAQVIQDLDGTPMHIAETNETVDVQHWSEELQWVGTAPRFHYIVGAYYYGEYLMQNQDAIFFAGASNSPYRNFLKTQSYSPFGQATWTPPILGDKLSITIGARYTQEQVHLDHAWLSPGNPAGAFKVSTGKAFGIHGSGAPGFSPMADFSYQWTDDLMSYFRLSRGFKAGGINPTAPSPEAAVPFKPERLLAYEVGFKTQWLDKRLRINLDGFYSAYSDLQENTFLPSQAGGTFRVMGNAEKAEIWGTEFEGTAVLVRGLEVSGSYSFIAPKYLKWTENVTNDIGQVVGQRDVSNLYAFPHTPHHQATAGISYTAPPTPAGVFSARLDTYWQDEVVFIANNTGLGSAADKSWAYAIVNGRLQLAEIPLAKGSLDLAVFGRNLLDRKYRTFGIDFTSALGFATNNYGAPRTFGVALTYSLSAS